MFVDGHPAGVTSRARAIPEGMPLSTLHSNVIGVATALGLHTITLVQCTLVLVVSMCLRTLNPDTHMCAYTCEIVNAR